MFTILFTCLSDFVLHCSRIQFMYSCQTYFLNQKSMNEYWELSKLAMLLSFLKDVRNVLCNFISLSNLKFNIVL